MNRNQKDAITALIRSCDVLEYGMFTSDERGALITLIDTGRGRDWRLVPFPEEAYKIVRAAVQRAAESRQKRAPGPQGPQGGQGNNDGGNGCGGCMSIVLAVVLLGAAAGVVS